MRDVDELFAALARSPFRSRFRLNPHDAAYLAAKGLATIRRHAGELLQKRLAPATPANDGRQTPLAGHPVFVAQHATATCCRKCLGQWHRIPSGRALTQEELQYVEDLIMHWLAAQDAVGRTQTRSASEEID